jgi:hypothetical protein
MGFFIKIMARPVKHNVDYFSHDCDMRNDIKIKALRRKYKHLGYSIYIITLELLGDTEYFQIKWDDSNIELLTSEYDCDADELKEIINYCIQLDLFRIDYGYLHCPKFTKRLEDTVLLRRKDYCSNNSPISKLSGVNVNNNEVIDTNNRQSKVDNSKVDNSKVKQSILDKSKLLAAYNAPDLPEIENNEVDYFIDETEVNFSYEMLDKVIQKFVDLDSRFKYNSVMREIDEDYGGFDNLLEMYLPGDTSAQTNYRNKLKQYKNGIFA